MTFVDIHRALFGGWIGVNRAPGLPHFDPPFTVLAVATSVAAARARRWRSRWPPATG